MKTWITFVAMLLMATTLEAQGRGGMRGGGMRGQVGSPHFGARSISNIPPVVRPGVPGVRPFVPINPSFSGTSFRPSFHQGFGAFRTRPIVGASQFPFYSFPYSYPSDPFYSTPYYSSPYGYGSPQIAPSYTDDSSTTNQLIGEIQELRSQVQQLQYDLDTARADASEPMPQPVEAAPAPDPGPPTVLVFQDGHRLETRGYAMSGTTLWVIDGDNVTKIPMSQLNIAATRTENLKRGIVFKAPGT